MRTRLTFLVLEDSEADAVLAETLLREEALDFEWRVVATRDEFMEGLKEKPDLLLADYALPSFGGMEALVLARQRYPDLPVVFYSGAIGEERAIECLRAGATDYVLKHRLSRLGPVVRRALEEASDRRQKKMAQDALRTAARTQRALLEAASVARVVPWSVEEGKLVLGHSASDVLGLPLNALPDDPSDLEVLIYAEDRPLYRKAQAVSDPNSTSTFECRMRHADGTLVWTRWTLQRAPFHGVFQDISEQRSLQEQLMRSQRLEALGTLAAGISHDFNNLLQVILGHSERLGIVPDLDPNWAKALRSIQAAAHRGHTMVERLLAFTRRTPLHRTRQNLNALVEQCHAMLEGTLPAGIRWDVRLFPGIPDIELDGGQLNQVLVNLIINARDAMGKTGVLALRTGQLTLTHEEALRHQQPQGTYAFIEVGDSGCGIPKDKLGTIFEPFFTTKGDHGTGLGLAMAQGIVESHNGWFRVWSDPGKGTRFRILFPLEEVETPDPLDLLPCDDWPSGPRYAREAAP